MGLPYSREINAAFNQVTPLVAAGFKVLQTTRNISILLAAIQVLTVVLLALILFALMLVVYSVNPDLAEERRTLVTPFLRSLARLTVWRVVRGLLSAVLGVGIFVGGVWWLVFGTWEEREVEKEGGEDADRALEEVEGGKGAKKGKKEKSGDEKNGAEKEKK